MHSLKQIPSLRIFLISIFWLITFVNSGFSQTPELIRDIESTSSFSLPGEYGVTNNFFLFNLRDPNLGAELFKSDGTTQGTELFVDLNPGPDSSSPSNFVTVTNNGTQLVFFSAATPGIGDELWRSDGTVAGTFPLEINPGTAGARIRFMRAFGDKVVFVATKAGEGRELWISDGSLVGTLQISNIRAGALDGVDDPGGNNGLLVLNSPVKRVFFLADDGAGIQFFRSEGTLASTVKVTNLSNDLSISSASFSGSDAVGIYFNGVLNLSSGSEVLHLNPATNVVSQAAEIEAGSVGSEPQDFAVIGNRIIFTAKTVATGREVYSITAGVPGFTLLADLVPGGGPSFDSFSFTNRISPLKSLAYFVPDNRDEISSDLYVTDGTISGTKVLLKNTLANVSNNLVNSGAAEQMVFTGRSPDLGSELFSTLGTPETTFPLTDIFTGPASSIGGRPALFKSLNFFVARTASSVSLFSNDGTVQGTKEIKQLIQLENGGSSPRYITNGNTSNQKVLFTAGKVGLGFELYASDGSVDGTSLLADIAPGEDSPNITYLSSLSTGTLFSANNISNGNEIWISDGTQAGTKMVKDINLGLGNGMSEFTNIINAKFDDNTVFFVADDGIHGLEPWKTNGTPEGTVLIRDIITGGGSSIAIGGAGPQGASFNGKVLFAASETPNNLELFISDGTLGGTKLLKEINPGSFGSNPSDFTAVDNSRVFFAASESGSGNQLWVSDGTLDGTTRISNSNLPQGILPARISAFGSKVLFSAFDPATGSEPWVSDGTSSGTFMLADINPGTTNTNISKFTTFKGRAYFNASKPDLGDELWVTDGTSPGTKLFLDITPGTGSSSPSGLMVANEKLYFYANVSGVSQFFESDGTPEGTKIIAQSSDKSANVFTSVFRRGSLYFTGFNTTVKNEPFKLVFDACPDDPTKVSLGFCGCGVPEPGVCGCGVSDTDINANGITDCQTNLELKSSLNSLLSQLRRLKAAKNGKVSKKQKAQLASLRLLIIAINQQGSDPTGAIKTSSGKSVSTFIANVVKFSKKTLKIKSAKFKANKKSASKSITDLIKQIL